jgi:hypothetical protein
VVDGATTLMRAGERAGIPTPFGCRMGICHTCLVPLRSGRGGRGLLVGPLSTGRRYRPDRNDGSRQKRCRGRRVERVFGCVAGRAGRATVVTWRSRIQARPLPAGSSP